MDVSLYGVAKSHVLNAPKIIKTSALALIGWSPNASVQDIITEIIVTASQPILNAPAALLKSQIQCKVDPGIWGRTWISKCSLARPDQVDENHDGAWGVRAALLEVIKQLGDGSESFPLPEVLDVEAEWTGYRSKVSPIARRPSIPEHKQYQNLMEEVELDSTTILYFHGGAFCLMDPSTHRLTTSTLAQLTHGRCLSVRYRLAPQDPFPCALLDALVSYLSLLYPPPGSFHDPVPPEQIVLAGDSSGANVATSLLLLLLTLPKIGIGHINFHGREVDVKLPAGLAVTSPWLDISRSLPSTIRNTRYDIIAPPSPNRSVPYPNFPPDSIWPTSPPRVETYCQASMISHPLVSPLAAKKELWIGAPSVYVSVGWEGMQDEAEVFARRLFEAGGRVRFDGYVGMPHAFAVVPWCWMGRRAMREWARFCAEVINGMADGKIARESSKRRRVGMWVDKGGSVREVKLERLAMRDMEVCGREEDLTDEIVDALMIEQREWRMKLEEELVRKWKDSQR